MKLIFKTSVILILVSITLGVSIHFFSPDSFKVSSIKILSYSRQILELIGLASIIVGIYSYSISQKSLNLSVLQSCITRFQTLAEELNGEKPDPNIIEKYIELVNEELFYMANGYLPKEVQMEWLDGIINYIPLYSESETGSIENINPSRIAQEIENKKLLGNYYRIQSAFTIKNISQIIHPFKKELIYKSSGEIRNQVRRKIMKKIIQNLRNTIFIEKILLDFRKFNI